MRKKLLLAVAAVGASVAVFAVAQDAMQSPTTGPAIPPAPGTAELAPATKPAPTTQETLTRVSYGLGYDMGKNMKQAEVQLDVGLFTSGVQDALGGAASKYTEDEIREAFATIQQTMMEKEQAKEAAAGAKAEAEGKAFLDANRAKPNVKTTESGLQYEVVAEGTGPTPKPTDTVKVHYTGTLVDGTKFDSSVDRGQPAEFQLDEVIKGWTEGLQLVKTGGKAKLYIPAALGYGPRGAPPVIPPNATLVFDVELLEIVPPTAPSSPEAPATPAAPTQQP